MTTDTPEATLRDAEKPNIGGLAALRSLNGVDVRKLQVEYAINEEDPDEEFGGTEERARMEKRLVRKLDVRYAANRHHTLQLLTLTRFAILCLMYILNYIDRTAA
jgi:MFS transporter, ACS family, DAL5 transporter family protein